MQWCIRHDVLVYTCQPHTKHWPRPHTRVHARDVVLSVVSCFCMLLLLLLQRLWRWNGVHVRLPLKLLYNCPHIKAEAVSVRPPTNFKYVMRRYVWRLSRRGRVEERRNEGQRGDRRRIVWRSRDRSETRPDVMASTLSSPDRQTADRRSISWVRLRGGSLKIAVSCRRRCWFMLFDERHSYTHTEYLPGITGSPHLTRFRWPTGQRSVWFSAPSYT